MYHCRGSNEVAFTHKSTHIRIGQGSSERFDAKFTNLSFVKFYTQISNQKLTSSYYKSTQSKNLTTKLTITAKLK